MPVPIQAPVTDLEQALLKTDRIRTREIVRDSCVDVGALSCIESLIIPVLEDIGRRWEKGDVALSQVYMSARICEEVVDAMMPAKNAERLNLPRLAVVVLEDHHSLGKRILYSLFRASGYEVKDYRSGVMADDLVRQVAADEIEILLISALMLPAALKVRKVVDGLKKVSPRTRVIVGGAPFRFDPELWKEVGADAMGVTASDTLALVQSLSGGKAA